MKTNLKSIATLLILCIINKSYAQTNWLIENENRANENIKLGNKGIGGNYVLKNTTVDHDTGKYNEVVSTILKHGDRGKLGGVNLVWGTMTEKISKFNYINIVRKPGYTGALKTGELVALRFENGGFLSHGESTVGVDLVFEIGTNAIQTNIPYEFSFFDQTGENGIEVKTNIEYGIMNSKSNDYLIYCRRDYGVNLEWYKNCRSGELSILDELKNKISLAERGANVGKRLYKIVKD